MTVRFPRHVVWLATDACNARCLHCSSNSARRSPDELTTDEALAMLDGLAEVGVFDLAVSGGEPLSRPDLMRVLGFAKARGFSVGVGTNGAALGRVRATALAEVGVDRVQVSLDGFEAEHDWLRAWPGLYRRAHRAIDAAMEAGLRVHVCCTVHRENVHLIERLADHVAGLGVRRLNVSRYVPTGRGTDHLDLTDAAWHDVSKRVVDLRRAFADRMQVTSHLAQEALLDPQLARTPAFEGCQAGRGQACITANGTVLPCVLLSHALGSIRDASFREIWSRSSLVASLQDRDRLEGACGSCEVRERCGGCRAVAFARTGRVLATDPRCWLPETHKGEMHGHEANQDRREQERQDRRRLLPVRP